ncbi:MAG: hypothetical protein A3J84_05995 [Ignavibacteria bacterium RIFOXYA2_FULL_37_17]|nr:MAG: hypothetical protein A3J84_05995 [Ignavibacteria bacterium RIFOXYA2_FULL_37_17]
MHLKEDNLNNHQQWSVEKGDYQRDDETTKTFLKKRNRIKRIKTIAWIIIYFTIISIISYFLFAFI